MQVTKTATSTPFCTQKPQCAKFLTTIATSVPTNIADEAVDVSKLSWVGKGSIYKFFQQVDTHVANYLNDHPDQTDSSWATFCHYLVQNANIATQLTSFQIPASYITDNTNASITNVIDSLKQKIPGLEQQIIIVQNSKKGAVKLTFEPYISLFTTVGKKKASTLPTKPLPVTTTMSTPILTSKTYLDLETLIYLKMISQMQNHQQHCNHFQQRQLQVRLLLRMYMATTKRVEFKH